tara:strand:- start:140 stop:1048 length:909 start_codon:yes stop_codon:yes gene_type:complete
MANTLTTITSDMVQDEVLPALKLGLTPLNAVSFETSDVPRNVGDSVSVGVVTARTAATYSSTFESGDSTVVGTDVTMAAPTFASWYVNPNLEAQSTLSRFMAQGRECAYGVAKKVTQDVLGKFVEANIGSTSADESVILAANYDVDDQADMLELLANKGVNAGVSAIHNVSYATALRKDTGLQDASAYGNASLIQTGELPPVFGIRQFYTDAFPTAVTSENTGVIFTGRQTAAVAVTVPNQVEQGLEGAAGVRIMQVTDPATGLSLVWRTWLNSSTGAYWGCVYVMHGQSFIQDAAVRVVSA